VRIQSHQKLNKKRKDIINAQICNLINISYSDLFNIEQIPNGDNDDETTHIVMIYLENFDLYHTKLQKY
jgi:hypothetical protein